MLSEKYLAGVIDADGSFGVRFFRRKEGDFRPACFFEVSQSPKANQMLYALQESFGGTVSARVKGTTGFGGEQASSWSVPHTQGKKLLARIEKFLVVKRARVSIYLKYLDTVQRVPADRLALHQQQLRTALTVQHPLPNYPSRKWLAGYFDGDGCFASRVTRAGRSYLSARVTAHKDADAGVRLLHKAFGGAVNYSKGEHLPCWVLHMPPSKAKQFVGFFAKHLIVKRAQAYFVLGCAEGGNYRDGHTIHSILRQLKAQGQRLNDTGADVSTLLEQVRFDVPDGRGQHMRKRQSGAADAA
jgi:hypothetical protein